MKLMMKIQKKGFTGKVVLHIYNKNGFAVKRRVDGSIMHPSQGFGMQTTSLRLITQWCCRVTLMYGNEVLASSELGRSFHLFAGLCLLARLLCTDCKKALSF
ncbi:hypothetical protein MKW98_032728 [Papaver atlanticum]|uniref:Uncharacterized protein n=1 Tax=Papaver atlanticum TaxID=357466 RepID=A0AAD4RZ62_9MAGN|nr:hypothetical protein MKW98_032728 [Papaver atlanticum]